MSLACVCLKWPVSRLLCTYRSNLGRPVGQQQQQLQVHKHEHVTLPTCDTLRCTLFSPAVLAEGFYLPMGRQLLSAVAEELPKLPAELHKSLANQ